MLGINLTFYDDFKEGITDNDLIVVVAVSSLLKKIFYNFELQQLKDTHNNPYQSIRIW